MTVTTVGVLSTYVMGQLSSLGEEGPETGSRYEVQAELELMSFCLRLLLLRLRALPLYLANDHFLIGSTQGK